MIKEDRLCKLRRRIYMRLYFNTEISIRETKVITKSCKVTTIVNTNHFPQNLKKRYWSSLAIVVPQSGSLLRSGDRLFEWPKLSEKKEEMKAVTAQFTIAHLHKHAFCGIHRYLIILLDGRVFFVSHLPFKDYSTISTIYKTFLNVKLMKKWEVLYGLKLSKLNSFLEPSLWRTIEFTGELLQVRLKILHLYALKTIGQFWAQCIVWSMRKVFVRFVNFS